MASITEEILVKRDAASVWRWLTEPQFIEKWLLVKSTTGTLRCGRSFVWRSLAPFDAEVGMNGSVITLEPFRFIRLRIRHQYIHHQSELTISLCGGTAHDSTVINLNHSGLPESDLGLFETNGFSHYWRQHLQCLREMVESLPQSHSHRAHTGIHFVGGHPHLGLLVGGVLTGSPASECGVRSGDVLQTLNGVPVRTIPEYDAWLDEALPCSIARLGLARGEVQLQLPPVCG